MALQSGMQTTMNILPDISKRKDSQTMKFGQLIEYNVRNIFLQKSFRKRNKKEIVLVLFFSENFMQSKSKQFAPQFQYFFGSFGLGHTTKINCMKLQTDDPEICFISVFKKNLGLVSSPRFVHDFSSQILSMLYSINLTNFNVCFSLLLEVSHNMFIPNVCFPVCNVKNLEIYIRFLIKFFSYRTKNSPGPNPD